jgi:integrase/recombinase XerC
MADMADELSPLPSLGEQSPAADFDVLAMLLRDKRSENTRKAYRQDVAHFFAVTYNAEPSPDVLRRFFALSTPQMTAILLPYKARLIADGRTEATINRRLSAIKSLLKMARRVGLTAANPAEALDYEKIRPYRDTRGISAEQAKMLLRLPDKTTPKGRRDYALLLLLLENALRRAEVCGADVGDFAVEEFQLSIRGKGQGTQKQAVTLSRRCVQAIQNTLTDREDVTVSAPLFVNHSPAYAGRRLTDSGLYAVVRGYAEQAGFEKPLSPHRLRHTAITMALDASGGDIRKVQRLSRHVKMETLRIYDDNRQDLQGEMTQALSRLLDEETEGEG